MGDVHHGMVFPTLDRAAGPLRMAPVRPGHVLPPAVGVPKAHWCGGGDEHDGSRGQPLGQGIGIESRIGGQLCQGDVARGLHELLELGVRDGSAVHPEAPDVHWMGWCLLGIVMVGSHQERASWDPEHVARRRTAHSPIPHGQPRRRRWRPAPSSPSPDPGRSWRPSGAADTPRRS